MNADDADPDLRHPRHLRLIITDPRSLRQCFDVHEKLKASCLLNTKQEPQVDTRAIRNRRRQRYRPRRHRRVETAAIRL